MTRNEPQKPGDAETLGILRGCKLQLCARNPGCNAQSVKDVPAGVIFCPTTWNLAAWSRSALWPFAVAIRRVLSEEARDRAAILRYMQTLLQDQESMLRRFSKVDS